MSLPTDTSPLLQAYQVSYHRDGHNILRQVTCSLMTGELVGLIGPNGAGKSSLIKVLGGLWSGAKGEVRLLDKPLAHYSSKEIARLIAYVPQTTNLDFPFTVEQMVMMGRNPYLRRFQLETAHDRLVVGKAMSRTRINSLAHRWISTLSGGERQRVLVARALAQEPIILLLDEPTANLDIQHQYQILLLLRSLIQECGLSVIAAIHDLELAARFCDRIILLHQGSILAEGLPENVMNPENLYQAYGVEVHPYRDPITGYLRLTVLDQQFS